MPDPAVSASPRVLGVDEFALRKGHSYGTLLVDVETRRPVDILDERSSESFAVARRPPGRGADLPGPGRLLFRRRRPGRTGRGAGSRQVAPVAQPRRGRRARGHPAPGAPAGSGRGAGRGPCRRDGTAGGRDARRSRAPGGSRTGRGAGTPTCTGCWPTAAASARSPPRSACPATPSAGSPAPPARKSCSSTTAPAGGPASSTSTRPTCANDGTPAAPTPRCSGRRSAPADTREAAGRSAATSRASAETRPSPLPPRPRRRSGP